MHSGVFGYISNSNTISARDITASNGFSIHMICFLNIISHTFNGCLYFNYSFLNFSFESGKGCGLPKQNRGSFHGGIFLGVLSRHGFEDNLINQTETFDYSN